MTTAPVEKTAQALVADGKGILAVDETVATLTRCFDALHVESTADSRRAYRELFFTTPGIAALISGVVLHDETIRQRNARGIPFADLLAQQGIIPGIKVDLGVAPLARSPREYVTEGLDGLSRRLEQYRELGARFAKWRAVITVTDALPTAMCTRANAEAMARYAGICQAHGLVPIVQPEVLMDGSHAVDRCEAVTGDVLHAVFDALHDHRVCFEGMLLQPNMVLPGMASVRPASLHDIASATVRCLRRHVPPAVPGIVFLSGGQNHLVATTHLSAINQQPGPKPWTLSFCYARALQDEALRAWQGCSEHDAAAQRAFHHRATCLSAAVLGGYTAALERDAAVA
jgi:fructose-bisphosphate aldolase class I